MTGWNIDVPKTEYYGPLPGAGMTAQDYEKIRELVRELADYKDIALDTETTGLVVWKDRPLYFSLAWGSRRATLHASILEMFRPIFDDSSKNFIFANAKYDVHMLGNRGIYIAGRYIDIQVMHSLLYEDKPHGLKFICQHLLGWTWGDFQDQFGRITAANTPEMLMQRAERENFGLLIEYAANDAWGTLRAYQELKKTLESAVTHSLFRTEPPRIVTLWDLFEKVEVPYTKTLWRMERWGIKVNRQRLEDARPQAEAEIHRANMALNQYAGRVINMNSTAQLKAYFVDELKLPPLKWTKGGKTGVRSGSVDESYFKYYAEVKGIPQAQLVIDFRMYSKLLGTYINGLHDILDPYDRIHSRFNQDVARTGRLTSSDPNLQNIPRPENDKWALRKAFVAEEGYDIICFDYAQLEMRLLAAASGERTMIDMIHSGKDIHMGNTEIVFAIPYADLETAKKVDKKVKSGELPAAEYTDYLKHCMELRSAVKSIGFGVIYGMGPDKLANTIKKTRQEAEEKIAQFLRAYPAIDAFTEECIKESQEKGYAFTVLGRRRNLPDINSSRRDLKGKAERKAINTPIQGSAADVVKMAQIMYDKLGFERDFGCRMILQVHDELVFECPKENTKHMMGEIKEVMEHPFYADLACQLEAEGGTGPSWGSSK